MGKGKSATEKKDVYKSKTAQLCSERRSSKAPVPVPEKVIRGRTSADGTDGKPQVPGSAISGQAKNETRLECKVLQPVVPDLEASTSDFCADDKAKPADTTGNSALDTAGAAPSLNVRAKDTLRKYHFRARGCKDGESCRHLHSSPEERHSGGHTVSRTGRETATRILKRLSANPKPRSPSDPAAGAGAAAGVRRRAKSGSTPRTNTIVRLPARDPSSLTTTQLRYWLQQQLEQSASTNIEDLSCEDSDQHKVFLNILERRNLPEAVVDKMVELLTKEETCSSMMRHKTNRIYGFLQGSPFMVQLQAQIQGLVNPQPRKVQMYVKLVEELQGRTADGWKEVPLDAIKTLVAEMEMAAREAPTGGGRASDSVTDTALDDLLNDVNRLLEQRDKVKRLRALSTSNNFQGEEISRLPILPSEAEITASDIVARPLPVNQVGRRYTSVLEYLETHFQLLREDYIEPMRQGINAFRKHSSRRTAGTGTGRFWLENHDIDLNIYVDVRFEPCPKLGRKGIERQVAFRIPGRIDINWETSKRLMFGSLLCVSDDEFQTFFWALVVRRDAKDLAKGRVHVRLITESDLRAIHQSVGFQIESPAQDLNSKGETKTPQLDRLRWFERSQRFVMVESVSAYFEAYVHVLKSLQREDMSKRLVFTKHLIDLEPIVGPPSYLGRRPQLGEFNFSTVFPELRSEIGRDSFDILATWPEWRHCSLDDSQKKALKHGLTKELALIQGPPGTGKTYVGLLLVKALLANLKPKEYAQNTLNDEEDVPGPILVVCYTNHALDQFLLGIYEFEKNLIRIGGRSKHPALMAKSLTKLVLDQRLARAVDGSHHRASRVARNETQMFEPAIQKILFRTSLVLVNPSVLRDVATPAHVESLFSWKNRAVPDQAFTDENVVQIWLAGSEVDFENAPGRKKHVHCTRGISRGEINNAQTLSVNKFNFLALDGEDDEAAITKDDPADAMSIDSDEEYECQGKQDSPSELQEEDYEEELGTKYTRKVRFRQLTTPTRESGLSPLLNCITAVKNSTVSSISHLLRKNRKPFKIPVDEQNVTPGPILAVGSESASGESDNNWFPTEDDDESLVEQTQVDLSEDTFTGVRNVWKLSTANRRRLHEHWISAIKRTAKDQVVQLSLEYELACKRRLEVETEIQLALLRKAKVVGMTTTAGARLHDLMVSLKPTIVVVEEAAEVLESCVLACLSPHTKHLILIGDHQQLRPSVSTYKLAVNNKLDVSLFERLVRSGVEYKRLDIQRRMRESISQLVQGLYPNLKDHASVIQYPDVTGVTKNVFFLDHKAEESDSRLSGTGSKVNKKEAAMVVEFCLYLLKQGCYLPSNITILSMYSGQVQEIKRLLHPRIEAGWPAKVISAEGEQSNKAEERHAALEKFPRVSSVDDFQGEESDIILLSLVRSNQLGDRKGTGPGKIGFLNIPNRVCVAISRARIGLYLFGDAELLATKNELWRNIIGILANSNSVGPYLTLSCQNHADKQTRVAQAGDFKQVADGGCSRPCEYQLPCGHVCPRRCHPGNHDAVACIKPCSGQYDTCQHLCPQVCHGGSPCPPCMKPVVKYLPVCGHKETVPCSETSNDVVCKKSCQRVLTCGHPCRLSCGQPCISKPCSWHLQSTLPCGHTVEHRCSEDPTTLVCKIPCRTILDGCNHKCRGTCGDCKQGKEHVPCQKPCQRPLPCGHNCESLCSVVCPPCQQPCMKRCVHSKCSLPCGEPCVPCIEKCAWRCRHHHCDLRCHETCTRPRCDRRCNRKLKSCGHRCSGLCGEPCPTMCKTCDGDTLDIISQMTLKELEKGDRIIQLLDCKHVFEVTGLDSWMDLNDTQTDLDGGTETRSSSRTAIKLKQCPQCRTPVRRAYRYANVVKTALLRIEDVKRRIRGNEHCKLGNEALTAGDPIRAIQHYMEALKCYPSLAGAHLAIGCAFAANKATYARASYHFQHLTQRSSFKSHPAIARAAKVAVSESIKDTKYYAMMFPSTSTLSTVTEEAVAVKAIVQWASLLTKMTEFDRAIQLCDAVLSQVPEDEQALIVKTAACKGQTIKEVVAAVSVEFRGSGHWYECPNGHIYAIGECGGAMETSRCPDCNAVIGGAHHTPASGNVHSRVDGSTALAWGNATGLGNFRM